LIVGPVALDLLVPFREIRAESVFEDDLVVVEVPCGVVVVVVLDVVHVTFSAAPATACAVPAVKQARATTGTKTASRRRRKETRRIVDPSQGVGDRSCESKNVTRECHGPTGPSLGAMGPRRFGDPGSRLPVRPGAGSRLSLALAPGRPADAKFFCATWGGSSSGARGHRSARPWHRCAVVEIVDWKLVLRRTPVAGDRRGALATLDAWPSRTSRRS
jgi:hypothetical protein